MHDKLKEITGKGNYLLDTSDIIFSFYGLNTATEVLAGFVKSGGRYDSPGEMGKALMGVIANVRRVDKVIFNDPATIAFVGGRKHVAVAKDGDEYDPLMGLMVCATRAAGKNRVSIDAWEHIIQYLADNLGSAKECRMLADVLNLTADMWDAEGVAEKMDEWAESKSGETGPATDFVKKPDTFADKVADAMAEALSAAVESDQERTRRILRDLIDGGEL